MRRIDSENCHTYSDAERLLHNARLYLHSIAPKQAIPPYRRPFYDALTLLARAHHHVLEAWASQVAHDRGGARDWAA